MRASFGLFRLARVMAFIAMQAMLILGPLQAIAQDASTVRPEIAREREHAGQVVFMGLMRGGDQLVTVDYTGGIFVWDAASQRQISTARRSSFPLKTAVALDSTALMIAGSMPNDRFALVDLAGTNEPRELGRLNGEIQTLIKAPDGNGALAAVWANDRVRVLGLTRAGQVRDVFSVDVQAATAVALSEDGRFLALAEDKSLRLVRIADGSQVWRRGLEDTATSLAIGRDMVVASYDHPAASRLKRIDQFALGSGDASGIIKPNGCSVFQVSVFDGDQGVALCGVSTTDRLANMRDASISAALLWKLQTPSSSTRQPVAPVVGALGARGYLPFRAGVTRAANSGVVYVSGGGDGSTFAIRQPTQGERAAVQRLAPAPAVFQRLIVRPGSSQIMGIGQAQALVRDPKSGSQRETLLRGLLRELVDGPASEEEVGDFLEMDRGMATASIGNGVSAWDIERGALERRFEGLLGAVQDVALVAPTSDTIAVTRMIEASPLGLGAHFEPSSILVTESSQREGVETTRRRLFSIDSGSGLLKEGVRKAQGVRTESTPKVCPSVVEGPNARLSPDGAMLVIACLRLPDTLSSDPAAFLRVDFDLLTYWLDPMRRAPSARLRIHGKPSHVELSKDGARAAVLSSTMALKQGTYGQMDLSHEYFLTLVDTRAGVTILEQSIPEPGTETVMAFSGQRLYLAFSEQLFQVDTLTGALTRVTLRTREPAARVASIAVNPTGELIAVARQHGVTEVYAAATGERVGVANNPGEDFFQVAFDPMNGTRLVAGMRAGGLRVLDYASGRTLADLMGFEGNSWMAVAPDGVFSASIGGEAAVTISDGKRAVAIDQLYDVFFRPAMLRKRLAGDFTEGVSFVAVRQALARPPPTVESSARLVSDKVAAISLRIRDAGGGIGSLRIFHNGKLAVNLSAAEVQRRARRVAAADLQMQLDLPVAEGRNEYLAAAHNADLNAQSRFASAVVDRPDTAPATRRAFLLLIGTNTFSTPEFASLKLAEDSARLLGESLKTKLGGIVGRDNVVVDNLVGENSRSSEVEQALKRLEAKAEPDDIVAIVVTTHGKVLPSGELLAILRDTGPDNSGALPTARLLGALSTTKALTQILVLDICHAGVLSDRVADIYQERFAVFAGSAGIHILASTTAEEPAIAGMGNATMFSHFLIKGLSPQAESAGTRRTVRSVGQYVKQQMEATASMFAIKQVPAIYSFGQDLALP